MTVDFGEGKLEFTVNDQTVVYERDLNRPLLPVVCCYSNQKVELSTNIA